MNAWRRIHRSLSLCAVIVTGALLLIPGGPARALEEEEGGFFGGAFSAPELPVRIEPLAEPLVAGETVGLTVVYSIPENTHLTDTFFTVKFSSEPPLVFSDPVYPEPIVEKEDPIYRGEVAVWTTVTLPVDADRIVFSASAEYQICTEGEGEMCYPPGEATPSFTARLAAAGTDWSARNVVGIDPAVTEAIASGRGGAELAGGGDLTDRVNRALAEGSWGAFLLVFLAGVLLSFTPCVYPVIPLTIAYIGGSSQGNPLKGFILSLWFVLGIAITYSTIGLVVAATGGVFGQGMQNPWVLGSVAAVIAALGLSMAGLFDIQLPTSITSRVGGQRTGWLAPLIMGFATGLIAAPCVGPVLGVLLLWVGTTGNLFLGFWLLFTFAVGLGMLFLVLGTFSGALTALPGAGAWMEGVKHFFALVLWGLALWFLRNMLPGWLLTMVYGLVLVMALGAWGAFHTLPPEASCKRGMLRGVLLFLWILGVVLAIGGGLAGFAPHLLPSGGGAQSTDEQVVTHPEPEWIWDADEGFAAASQGDTPVMMDFWAVWCAACNELDHKSYSQPEVLRLAEKFTNIKMDMTEKTEENNAIQKRYRVVGMPTVIFFDSQGKELERFIGFKNAEDLAAILERVLQRTDSL